MGHLLYISYICWPYICHWMLQNLLIASLCRVWMGASGKS